MKFDSNTIIRKLIHYFEIFLSFIVLAGVLSGVPDLFRYIGEYITNPSGLESYKIFGNFLKHVLMLVVGLEMIYMIINHQNETILTLVLYVVARKMLVYADSMQEILLGTIAIVLVFGVLKFFVSSDAKASKFGVSVQGSLSLKALSELYHIEIESNDIERLCDYIRALAIKKGEPIVKGAIIDDENYEFYIEKLKDGAIKSVRINRLK
ncbi:MAG: hypothetical protein MR314_02150 [Ezakiella sp.]|nr:hypothetical protein [Ezakiella sp.]